jgi:HSP20 family protein
MSLGRQNNINHIFDRNLDAVRRRSGRMNNTFVPLMDVHETDNEFFVNTELPVCIIFFF